MRTLLEIPHVAVLSRHRKISYTLYVFKNRTWKWKETNLFEGREISENHEWASDVEAVLEIPIIIDDDDRPLRLRQLLEFT